MPFDIRVPLRKDDNRGTRLAIPPRVRLEHAAIDRIVFDLWSPQCARELEMLFAGVCRLEVIVACWCDRIKSVGVLHDVGHPIRKDRGRRQIGLESVRWDPIETPLEWPDNPILVDGSQTAFPGMEESLKHQPFMLYSHSSTMTFDTRKQIERKRVTRVGGVVLEQ